MNLISVNKSYIEASDYMALMALLLKETKAARMHCENHNHSLIDAL